MVAFKIIFFIFMLMCSMSVGLGNSLELTKRSMKIEKILIIGATGQAGSKMVKEAVDRGILVKAFCRNPNKLSDEIKEKVETITGDVQNYNDVVKAVKGVDAVIFTISPRNLNDSAKYMTKGLQNVIKAMNAENVEIINVVLSVFSLMPTEEIPEMFKIEVEDHNAMYDALKKSDLKYIASCPPDFLDTTANAYEAQIGSMPGGKNFTGGVNVISLNQLAKYFIDSLSKSEYYRQVVGIRNKSS